MKYFEDLLIEPKEILKRIEIFEENGKIVIFLRLDDRLLGYKGRIGWLGGSNIAEPGAVHFLEHILAENQKIKELGRLLRYCSFNAETSFTIMDTYFRISPFAKEEEINILEKIITTFLSGEIDEQEIQRQKNIVISEIKDYRASGTMAFYEGLSLFGNKNILGNERDVENITMEKLTKTLKDLLSYKGIIICCGHPKVKDWILDNFQFKFGNNISTFSIEKPEQNVLKGGDYNYIIVPIERKEYIIPLELASIFGTSDRTSYWAEFRNTHGVYAAGMFIMCDYLLKGPGFLIIYFSSSNGKPKEELVKTLIKDIENEKVIPPVKEISVKEMKEIYLSRTWNYLDGLYVLREVLEYPDEIDWKDISQYVFDKIRSGNYVVVYQK